MSSPEDEAIGIRAVRAASVAASNLKLKQETFRAYGGVCSCCAESRFEFLTIDHIGGNKITPKYYKLGAYHAYSEYRELRKRGYPKGNIRLLCMNCNWAMKNGRTCPHKIEANLPQNS